LADQIPTSDRDSQVHGWIREAIQEGESFVKAQPGYNLIAKSIEAVGQTREDIRPGNLSTTSANHYAKVADDLAAYLTDIKPFWEYRTQNKRYEKQSEIFGKRATHWYLQRQIDLRLLEVVKYWLVAGTGFPHVFWNPEIGDTDVRALDPRDVLPIRPSSNLTLQDAFGAVIREERTVNSLRRRWPQFASQIHPDRDGSTSSRQDAQSRAAQIYEAVSPFWDRIRGKAAREIPRIPTADHYTVYLRDDSRNENSYPVQMGEFDQAGRPLTNWSYIVQPDEPLYPRGRCITATNTVILHDGPNRYWHGLIPLPKFTLNPWPWSWLGKAPLWDLLPLQKSLNSLLRVVDDHNERVARPGLIADKNSISKSELNSIDTRRAGLRIRHNPTAGKGVVLALEPPLDPTIEKTIQFLINEMDTLSGVRDLGHLSRLNQLPSGDTIERLVEAMTPKIRLWSRMMESFVREFAMMLAYNFAQFDTLPIRLHLLGEDGVTPEDFDFDPGSLIPDYVHASDFDNRGVATAEALARGPMPRFDRAQEFLRQFTFHIAPGSLLSASEIERKLLYLQLARAGLVDPWTLLEVLGIPNVGNPPSGANSITERLQAAQSLGIGMQVNPAGRKASGQEMPRMVMKES